MEHCSAVALGCGHLGQSAVYTGERPEQVSISGNIHGCRREGRGLHWIQWRGRGKLEGPSLTRAGHTYPFSLVRNPPEDRMAAMLVEADLILQLLWDPPQTAVQGERKCLRGVPPPRRPGNPRLQIVSGEPEAWQSCFCPTSRQDPRARATGNGEGWAQALVLSQTCHPSRTQALAVSYLSCTGLTHEYGARLFLAPFPVGRSSPGPFCLGPQQVKEASSLQKVTSRPAIL